MTKEELREGATEGTGSLIGSLRERAKELACLYSVEAQLRDAKTPLPVVFAGILRIIPEGWRYPDLCKVRIDFGGERFEAPGFAETPSSLHADIAVLGEVLGRIAVSYPEMRAPSDGRPFLDEEIKLIETIAERLGHFILHQRLSRKVEELISSRLGAEEGAACEWRVALDLLRRTDQRLLGRVSRCMMNQLCLNGVAEAKALLARHNEDARAGTLFGESNQPRSRKSPESLAELSDETFRLASAHYGDGEILDAIQRWIHEDKAASLVGPITDGHAPLNEVVDGILRYRHQMSEGLTLSQSSEAGVLVSLISRFFTDQLALINVAKPHLKLEDFFGLVERIISPPRSYGRLGGKSAGMFIAGRILEKMRETVPEIGETRTPRSFYVTSDALLEFLRYNGIDEVYEHKYKSIDEVRQEYPHILNVFKSSQFPQEIEKGLSMALDALGDVPLIVRSSSLLEDRFDAAFSGKYKSLFLANQGDKKRRLDALMDAVAEVYASILSPDPIEYRAERGLLDFNEEMGIIIQEVVGKRVGRYFFPAFAGVAFSNNEFRWSPRIKAKDGLVRLVPGLGTRAVDRVADDYPVLIAPGQPNLRVNVSRDEIVRYAPKRVDVIDLEGGEFETVELRKILETCGGEYPAFDKVFSVLHHDSLVQPTVFLTDFARDELVVTFDGLFRRTDFVKQMGAILTVLERAFGTPVDIEFASDGERLYLLQCRPQSRAQGVEATAIPESTTPEDVVFTANRYVSNGSVEDITHVVYVVPDAYDELAEHSELVAVGQAIGRLNKILPRRRFILVGPGRWGSRGDIKLGVRVTYSDINNTAMLVEVARKKGNYVPDLSFGTHFFQDLVESSIRYLPLYPDDPGIIFNQRFFAGAPNALAELVPELAALSHVVRVIDVPSACDGRVLRVFMNADRDQALGLLCEPLADGAPSSERKSLMPRETAAEHWRWRLRMAERIGREIDAARFGVKALYVLGSTKNATAGPGSDLDLLIHFRGDDAQRRSLEDWLDGWSLCLAEANFLRTGFSCERLLDAHFVTDDEIDNRSGIASKIGATTDAALAIPIGAFGA